LNFAFLWAIYLLQLERSKVGKSFIVINLGIIGVGILLSLTRAVWVGFFVSLVIVQLFDRKWRRPFVLGASGLIFVLLVVWFIPSETTRISQRARAEDTVYQRLVAYRLALMMFVAKPIAGYGRGDEAFISERAKFLGEIDSPWLTLGAEIGPPHNQYLSLLTNYGLIGLILYGSIFFLILRPGINLLRALPHTSGTDRQFAILFSAMTASHLVQALFVDIAAFPFVTSVLFIFAGALQGLGNRAVLLVNSVPNIPYAR
jgi:O-antigen ligase